MKLLGWSVEQWAIAAAWYQLTEKKLPPAGVLGAVEIRRRWMQQRADEPGEIALVGVVRPRNDAWAWAALEQAIV